MTVIVSGITQVVFIFWDSRIRDEQIIEIEVSLHETKSTEQEEGGIKVSGSCQHGHTLNMPAQNKIREQVIQ